MKLTPLELRLVMWAVARAILVTPRRYRRQRVPALTRALKKLENY